MLRDFYKGLNSLQIFFASYIIFLLSHFVFQKAIYSSLLFYLTLLPSFLCYVYKSRNAIKELYSENKLLIFLLLYLTIHSIFMMQEMGGNSALKGIRNIIATSLFLSVSLFFFKISDNKVKHSLFLALAITCGVFALFSIMLYIYNGMYASNIRLLPLGFARQEILGASLYGAVGIMSIYLFFTSSEIYKKILFAAIFLAILIMILLTVSRGPILSCLSCSGLAMLIFSKNRLRFLISAFLATILILVFIFIISDYNQIFLSYAIQIMERGTSYRLTLWQLTLDRIIERPILGYGVRNIFESDVPGGYSPHNLYLSTAYYFGIPALLILLGLLTQSLKRSLIGFTQSNYSKLLFVLVLHALFSVVTDHGQLVRGNTPIWIIFWLPLCMSLAHTKRG